MKYCLENSIKSRCFCCKVAADTSFNQGFSITRSDFVGNFGLGFVSLSYELNESTQAFHTIRTHPNVFARSSSATAGHVLKTFLASADAKGYDDWYIPSCGELSLIYMHLTSVNNALSAIGGQQLTKDYYLSSSEYDPENFWIVLFNNGRVFKRPKRLGCRVRFVRKIE